MLRLLFRLGLLVLLWFLVIRPSVGVWNQTSDTTTGALSQAYWWMSAKAGGW